MQQLDVLYQDEWMAAVSKPPRMLVHRTEIATEDTVFALQCAREQFGRHVWPVHRLDRGTSGVLLFAFSPEVAGTLGRQWMEGSVRKRYAALVRGWIEGTHLCTHPLSPIRDPKLRMHRSTPQEAASLFEGWGCAEVPVPNGPYEACRLSLVGAEPLTGRRHQLRRHLKWLSHPVIGDATYGKGPLNRDLEAHFGCGRLFLHCAAVSIAHPEDGRRMVLRAPLEAAFESVLEQAGLLGAYERNAARPWEPLEMKIPESGSGSFGDSR